MNLPSKIFAGTEEVSYIYSASGQKLATKVGDSYTYYRGSFVYNDGELDHMIHPEGLIRKASGGYVYYYAKKDHLGSTRVLCHEADGVMQAAQTTDYYPFGLSFRNYGMNFNRYLFSGKELQDQVVNGKALQLYDFGARNYDPIIGRWFNIDPALQFVNPYTYCANNPVMYTDPDGKRIFMYEFVNNHKVDYEWKENDGIWGFYDNQGALYGGSSEFFGQVSTALTQIMSGDAGANLVHTLVGMDDAVTIMQGKYNVYDSDKSGLSWNPNGSEKKSPTQNGKDTNVPYISLSHEMAHAQDDKQGTKDTDIWFSEYGKDGKLKNIPKSEIYSTHIENQIRHENGLSLRTHYAIDGMGVGAGPRIIDFKGQSIFYNTNNQTNYKTVPSKNRFRY